jgi:hypothetical protein
MINLAFGLANPFSKRFSIVYEKSGKTWIPYKFWEFNVYKTNIIIDFRIRYIIREDHAGLEIILGLLGWSVEYRFYDSRHWDYENNCWEVYENA